MHSPDSIQEICYLFLSPCVDPHWNYFLQELIERHKLITLRNWPTLGVSGPCAACSNLCRDEVTATLKHKLDAVFGSSFNTNGLGGVLTCGVTGIKAGLSHAPISAVRVAHTTGLAAHGRGHSLGCALSGAGHPQLQNVQILASRLVKCQSHACSARRPLSKASSGTIGQR